MVHEPLPATLGVISLLVAFHRARSRIQYSEREASLGADAGRRPILVCRTLGFGLRILHSSLS